MDLVVVGINHRTAPVALRERIAITPEEMGNALHDLRSTEGLEEVAILSSCNRTEIYAVKPGDDPSGIGAWLAKYHDLPVDHLADALYIHSGDASVRHLLRVASGLDSMVLGEKCDFDSMVPGEKFGFDSMVPGEKCDCDSMYRLHFGRSNRFRIFVFNKEVQN